MTIMPRRSSAARSGCGGHRQRGKETTITVALSRVDGQLPWPYPGCSLTLHLPDGWDAEPLDAADNFQGDTFTVRYRISQIDTPTGRGPMDSRSTHRAPITLAPEGPARVGVDCIVGRV